MRTLILGEQTLGHVTHLNTLEDRAAADGHETRIVRLQPGAPLDRDRYPGHRRLTRNYSVRMSLAARQELRRSDPDSYDNLLVHTQSAALFVPRNLTLPYVVSLDATPVNFDEVGTGYGHGVGRPATERLKRGIVGDALRRASAIVCFSAWAARSVIGDYSVPADRVAVVPPGVPSRSLLRKQPADGPYRLLFIGGDFRRKGGELLLRVVADLGGIEIDLVTKSEVPPQAGVRVHRDVEPGNGRLESLLASADAMVLPTAADVYSFASLEAMSAGLPVIATSVGGIPEIVRDRQEGILIPPDDEGALRNAIQTLALDPDGARAMGAAGQQRQRAHFDAGIQTTALFDLLASLPPRRR